MVAEVGAMEAFLWGLGIGLVLGIAAGLYAWWRWGGTLKADATRLGVKPPPPGGG